MEETRHLVYDVILPQGCAENASYPVGIYTQYTYPLR